jgi:linoleoyl-CoA desaturase
MQKYFTRKIGDTPIKKFTRRQHIIFWATKVFHVFSFVVLPMLTKGVVAALIGYGIMTMVCGIVIGVVFQLAHVVENTQFFTSADADTIKNEEWAVHQLRTTSNFATGNRLIHWYTGGLNHQVEHHLFPRISHVHYPAISRIVRDTCKQFGVAYCEHPTMARAVVSHISYLKYIGRND